MSGKDSLLELAVSVVSRKEKQNWEKKETSNGEVFYTQLAPSGKRYFHGSEGFIRSLQSACFKATGTWGTLSHVDNIEQLKFDTVIRTKDGYDKSPNVLCVRVDTIPVMSDIPAVKSEKKGSIKA